MQKKILNISNLEALNNTFSSSSMNNESTSLNNENKTFES
jgi:hypothetical protein